MKIIYVTDIHDALKELRVLLSTTEADLYLLSGDILYKAFYDETNTYDFVCLQEDFYTLLKSIPEKLYPYDFATDILRFPDRYAEFAKTPRGEPIDLVAKASEYRRLFQIATKTMKEKYDLIEGLIQKYGNAECLLLPGNYDIDLRYTALSGRSIHHAQRGFQGLRIAGYGGAPVATSGIPEKLAVVFHERIVDGVLYSDPETYFDEVKPEICVIHNPAYGYFDRIPAMGHMGSQGIRNHLDSHSPLLVVSGHVHEDYGIARKNGTILLNPSNFGGVDSLEGYQAGGTYAEVYLEDKVIKQVRLMHLNDQTNRALIDVKVDEEGLHETILPGAQDGCPLDLSVFIRDSSGRPAQR
ncbi:MAG: metallophosphoesterase [Spirochaetia bacterium]|nr:metallophosphoesterase [Spirochaetia bacterium]